jgi:4-hydroxybenzoate polyprenyl transferase
MNKISPYIELIRLKKPIGFMLLFWPCAWGLTLAYDFNEKKSTFVLLIILFFLGAVLMRSAGCIVNDIFDKNFDKEVFRTKERPIASGRISIKSAIFLTVILCLLAFIILIQFNKLTIYLALLSMPFAFTYPLMKRYTYWPQLFLGLTFNFGIILGWIAVTNELNILPFILYIGAVFWTMGYDTIYGFQDIKDDEIIGLKSTSIKFKKKPYYFLTLCYTVFLITIILIGVMHNYNFIFFTLVFLISLQLYFFQLYKLSLDNMKSCLHTFKSNNFLGLIIFLTLLTTKF